MVLRLVLVFFEKGHQTVLRGTLEDVERAIEYAEREFGKATTYGLSRNVSSFQKEDGMWNDFVRDIAQRDRSDAEVVFDCYRLWRREHTLIWKDPELHPILCRFTIGKCVVKMSESGDPEEIWGKNL